jgi:hemoglobin/transferrin/lactoferrin receptor protein
MSYGTAAQAQQGAQTPNLPEVTVETPKPQVKAAPPKATPKSTATRRRARPPRRVAQPAPPPPEPPAPAPAPLSPEEAVRSATTGAARDAAIQTQVYNTPASVSSIGNADLGTFGGDMNSALRSLPGTSVRESVNNPGIAVNIRGMEGSGRVNMMIDGVPQNFRFTGHEAQGFAYVDSSLLAGVDIARGAVSTAGGSGALAGAANFRTIDIIDVLKPGQTVGALSTASYGTNSQNWTGMQAAAVSNGRVGFIGAIAGRNPDNYKNGDGVTVPFTDQDLVSGLVKGEFRLTPDQKFKVSGVFYHNDFTANSYNQTLNNDIWKAEYHYHPTHTELVDLSINVSRSDENMVYHSFYTGSGGSAVGRNIDTIGNNFDITNRTVLRLGGVKIRSEYGYEYHHNDVSVINSTANPDAGVNPSGESSTEGAFSQTTFTYGIFDLITGLRYDIWTLKGSGSTGTNPPPGLPPNSPYSIDKDEGRFNPKVTLALRPTKWFMPFVTYAEAMRGPTVNESLAGGSHPGGAQQSFLPNPFLEPEIQKGWEVGFNTAVEHVFTYNDFFHFKANYYNNDVENYITACLTPTFSSFFCNNAGISKVQGIELQGMYDARRFFVGGSYTWTDSDLPSQLNGFGAQSYVPEHVASLSAGVRLFKERWTIGARTYIASKAFVGFAPFDLNALPDGSHYTDGYALLDFFTSFKITPDIEVGATVTNVTDEAYTPATSTGPTGGFDGETGRGRTAIFTVRAKF